MKIEKLKIETELQNKDLLIENIPHLSDAEKIEVIQKHFHAIMLTLGLDLNDDSLKDTPKRVAKMFVNEIFEGLKPQNLPQPTLFENTYKYNQMLIEKNISVSSTCEHHFLPIIGKAHIAYISSGKVIGLSKLNRIVKYFSKRPQVQERLTIQIANHLSEILETEDVAVIIDASHYCVISRGIEDIQSTTITSEFKGKFKEDVMQEKLLRLITLN